MSPLVRRLALAACLVGVLPLQGCLVGTAVGVAGAVVGTTVKATGAVVGAGVHAVTGGDKKDKKKNDG